MDDKKIMEIHELLPQYHNHTVNVVLEDPDNYAYLANSVLIYEDGHYYIAHNDENWAGSCPAFSQPWSIEFSYFWCLGHSMEEAKNNALVVIEIVDYHGFTSFVNETYSVFN